MARPAFTDSHRSMQPGQAAPRRRWTVLAGFLAIMTLDSIARFAIGPLSPFIIESFSLNHTQLGLLPAVASFGSTLVAFIGGRLIDHVGVRRATLFITVSLGGLLTLFFLPLNYPLTLLVMFFIGAVSVSTVSVTNLGLREWFPPREQTLSLSIKQTGSPLGATLGAAVLPSLALLLGWRATFGAVGLLILTIGAGVAFRYRSGPYRLDAAQPPAERRKPDRQSATPLSVTALLRRNPDLFWLFLFGFSFTAIQAIWMTFLVSFLREEFGLGVVAAGSLLSLSQFAGLVASPLLGIAVDAWWRSRRKAAVTGLGVLAATGIALLALLPATMPLPAMLVFLIAAGAGTLSWTGLVFALGLDRVPPAQAATLSGLMLTFHFAGLAVGPPLFGRMVDTGGFHQAFTLAAAVFGLVCVLFFMLYRERRTR